MNTNTLLTKLGVGRSVANSYASSIDSTATMYNINTKNRLAMFLAQILHESALLSAMVENMNYSAERLVVVFPSYFPSLALANQYAHNPQAIGNRVYANRMGNGNEASGDGYNYRGRGAIQITGKTNYQMLGGAIKQDLIANPSYLETAPGAIISAGWFWNRNGLNTLADAGDIVTCTKRINGGTNGLQDRIALYNKALGLI